ncbi:MAG: glycosyltransferase family 39 protein [Bacteroidetes bacterium]|nr:glycosyltransferase family 39 protein [Bacteroidota bacterium]
MTAIEANAGARQSSGLLGADQSFWTWISRHVRWIALAIFLLNVALKAPFLGGTSLFLDEAVAIYDTQGSVPETINFSANDPTPPLYYLTLGLWCKIFGISEFSARFPSMLFSSATAALLFLVGFRHFNVRAGLYAALLFTVSGVAMVFAHEARAYALASMLMVISYSLFLDVYRADRPQWKTFLGLVLVNTLLLYTHYLTSMGLAAQAVLSLWLLKGKIAQFLRYAASQVLVLALWLPWAAYNRSLLSDSKVTSWLKAPDPGVLDYVLINFAGSKFLKWMALAVIVVGAVAAIYVFTRSKRPEKGGFGIAVAAGWFFLSLTLQYTIARMVMPVFDLRYVMYALPGGFLLLGALISFLPLPRIFQYALVGTQLGAAIALLNLNPQKLENWRDAVALVKDMENDKTAMMVMAHYHYVTFSYYYNREYFKEHNQTTALFNNDNIHFGQDTALLPVIDDSLVSNIILVLSHDELVDPKGLVFNHLKGRYCIGRRGAFPGIKVYQFQNPPCKPTPGGHFVEDFEVVKTASEADRYKALPDSAHPTNKGTFVGPGHEFSASLAWKAADIHQGRFSAAEVKVRGKLLDEGKKVVAVFVMEHAGETYNWIGFELQQSHGAGVWFEDSFQVIIPEIKGPDDQVKVYFWSPDGGGGEFDNLEVDFWEG